MAGLSDVCAISSEYSEQNRAELTDLRINSEYSEQKLLKNYSLGQIFTLTDNDTNKNYLKTIQKQKCHFLYKQTLTEYKLPNQLQYYL